MGIPAVGLTQRVPYWWASENKAPTPKVALKILMLGPEPVDAGSNLCFYSWDAVLVVVRSTSFRPSLQFSNYDKPIVLFSKKKSSCCLHLL